MIPLTIGKGVESYSLYFPFSILKSAKEFQLSLFIEQLKTKLPEVRNIESIDSKGIFIIKFSGIETHALAVKTFNLIRKIFINLAIESNVAIYFDDSYSEPEPKLFCFPGSWDHGLKQGWQPDEESGCIQIDGVVNILNPVIVPEHKRIIDVEGVVGCLTKEINPSLFESTIDDVLSENFNPNSSTKINLAAKAYINALSVDNNYLKFLSFVTCLEILSEENKRNEIFQKALNKAIKAVNELTNESNNEEFIKSIGTIASSMGKQKYQSKKEQIEALVELNEAEIIARLPPDHPSRSDPRSAVEKIYSLRSKVAHSATFGADINEDIHRANQFAHVVAKAILKYALIFY